MKVSDLFGMIIEYSKKLKNSQLQKNPNIL